jgi:Cdc6-like AAA superfamily ATPase
MITEITSAGPQLSKEEAVRIMDEMDHLLDEIKETMGTIKKLMETEPARPGAGAREKVGSF